MISALSIARPVQTMLAGRSFFGRFLGLFERACNLIDAEGRIIALTLPGVGNGPFTIVIEGQPGLFNRFPPGQAVQANEKRLSVADWQISLQRAKIWEPRIQIPKSPPGTAPLIDAVKSYLDWPSLSEETMIATRMAQQARQAVMQLNQALAQPANREMIVETVSRLAGLGPGLTPAGDDYLIGVMAALWLTGRREHLPLITESAIPKTTALSRAFLKAAANGEFIEPWHHLVEAWLQDDRQTLATAVDNIAQFGASSGSDALGGFANTLVHLPLSRMRPRS